MTEPTDKARDYRDTVFLPKTEFPMKAGLPQKEPGIQARWEADGLYRRLREARSGAEKFILHDGPPYANGDMHIGHALNHILKDMVCRTQNLIGKDAPYVPGWDCHGLPIEWKVEEQYRKAKKNKDEVPPKEFRAECRAYAQTWVDRQREQLKRLGIVGDWDNPYLTMDPQAEGTIVAELLKFAESGMLYRGSKPVMWSPVEKTALAEAEVEYEDITSTQIDVAFEITECPNVPELVGAYAVIWTTTPWTIPVNQALAYGPEVEYAYYMARDGRKYLVAKELLAQFAERTGLDQGVTEVRTGRDTGIDAVLLKGSDLEGAMALHPMAERLSPLPLAGGVGGGPANADGSGSAPTPSPSRNREGDLAEFFERPRPFLPGEFVTTESGTGLVHMAPDHGEDDFALCKQYGIDPVFAVEGDGKYRDDWAWLGGQGSVINPKFNAPDGPICNDLREAGGLLAASADYQHSYPHSWRSKAKVIFRCTPQWFVPMDSPHPNPSPEGEGLDTLRTRAMAEIARVRFVPEKGRNRIGSMVEGRPDWVLSRQRAWGVPITLFVHRQSGDYLRDPVVNARIVAAIAREGVDAWDAARAQEFLGSDYSAEDFEMVHDILDVWFDSGSTHAFVLESGRWPDLKWPADLYLEGSDQHRGWFQSSLLESCATRGRAPYDQVLTHGFTMDAAGKKMSKSLGNTVDPLKLMETYGADIIRLWALSVDFTEDHRIGDEILKGVADQYRKLRNTFRYLLGALEGFGEEERLPVGEMPELERYILALLGGLDAKLRRAIEDYDFNTYTRALIDFCNEDLSAFYFDIRKDSLYCDAPGSAKRRACRTVLDTLFHALIRYAAPVLVFTAEEVWGTRFPDTGSVHLLDWPTLPRHSRAGGNPELDSAAHEALDPRLRGDDELVEKWDQIRATRMLANEIIEPMRREKIIGSSLEVEYTCQGNPGDIDLAEIFIVSAVHQGPTGAIRTTHHKCGRCWRHLPEVAQDGALCSRCDQVVNG